MAYYRLYYMNAHSGHIDSVATIDARDDQEAIRLAGAQDDEQPRELWCEHRKVWRFEAPPWHATLTTSAD